MPVMVASEFSQPQAPGHSSLLIATPVIQSACEKTKWRPQQHRVTSLLPFMSQVKSQLIFMSQVKSQLIFVSHVKSQLIIVSPVKSQVIIVSPVKSQLIFVSPVKSQLIILSLVMSQLLIQSLVMSQLIIHSHVTSRLIWSSRVTPRQSWSFSHVTSRLIWSSRVTPRQSWSFSHVTSQQATQSLITSCLSHPDIQGQSFDIPVWYPVWGTHRWCLHAQLVYPNPLTLALLFLNWFPCLKCFPWWGLLFGVFGLHTPPQNSQRRRRPLRCLQRWRLMLQNLMR